jgi:hypothetical protein
MPDGVPTGERPNYPMPKTLCDWSKSDIEKHTDKLRALTANPLYYCRKCARVASTSDVLCKGKRFPHTHPKSEADSPDAATNALSG